MSSEVKYLRIKSISKDKSLQNKPVYMQPRLPVPKKQVSHDALVNTSHMIENLDKENAIEHAFVLCNSDQIEF